MGERRDKQILTPKAVGEPPTPTCVFCASPIQEEGQACEVCVPDFSQQLTEELSRLAALYATTVKHSSDPDRAQMARSLYEHVLTRCTLLEAQAEASQEIPDDLDKAKAERRAQYRASAERRAEQLRVQVDEQARQLPEWVRGRENQ